MAEDKAEILSRCMRELEEDMVAHDEWSGKVDRWYRAWRGVLDRGSEAANWRHSLHPPYLLQIIETLAAGVMDPSPRWRVRPRPRQADMEEIEFLAEGAKALEHLLAYQRDADGFQHKQRAHRLQGLIAGLTVWKTYWNLEEATVKRRQSVESYDEYGMPQLEEAELELTERRKDDPCVEVVDVRDFIWHEAAPSIERAKRIFHRSWMSFDELKELEKQGYYSGVDELKESRSFTDQLASREQDLFNTNRTKDQIEVLECWRDGGEKLVVIGNRNVVLRSSPSPFAHKRYPFIACGPIPDLFRIPGVSVVELVEDLQEMLWTLQNRRLDNLELVANAILKVRDDVLDPTGFVFAPGEQWLVPDEKAIDVWQPDVRSAQITLDAEALIKADIQNIPGASPALLGQAAQAEQTATEVSLLTNLAQRRLAAQKYQFTLADIQVAEHWVELNRQFMTEQRYVGVVGADGEEGWELIDPSAFNEFQWRIEIDQMDDSLVRQERRAEAQAMLQVALTAAQVYAATGTPLNMRRFMEDFLDAFGVQDPEPYFSAKPQGMPQGTPGIAPPEEPGQGTTNPALAAGPTSPSNESSLSPVSAMQQMLAMQGGAANGEI